MTAILNVTPLTSMYESYIKAGFALVPIHSGKGPTTPGWNNKENVVTTIEQINPHIGYGLAHAYSNPTTCALDIDSWDDSVAALAMSDIDLNALVAMPDSVMIDSGNPGHAKLLFTLPFGLTLNSKKITHEGKTIYELRCATSNGKTVQDVLPSALNHPSTGKPYRWAGNGHYTRIPALPASVMALWQKLLEKDATRIIQTDTVMASWSEVASALYAIDPSCPRDMWVNVGMALHHIGTSANKLDEALAMWNDWSSHSFTKYAGERDIMACWRSFKASHNNAVTINTLFHYAIQAGWKRTISDTDLARMFAPVSAPIEPDLSFDAPAPKNDDTPPPKLQTYDFTPKPPDMDMDLFPGVLGRRAMEVSQSIGCDPLVPLFAGLAAVCAAVDSRSRLNLTHGYAVPPLLWLMTIGDPSDKKTPGATPMLKVLEKLEGEDKPRFAQDLLRWEAADAAHQASKTNYLKASTDPKFLLSGELDYSELPPVAPEPNWKPVDARLVVNDITSQKLVRIVADRPRGVLCFLDEMASWANKVTDTRGGEDRSTWTASYNSASYVMDRVGEKNAIHCENLAVAVYGNIQPQVFRKFIGLLSDDGLIQRFIPCVLRPDMTRVSEPIPDFLTCAAEWEAKIRQIYSIEKSEYSLDSDAYGIFRDFQHWYERMKVNERILGADATYMQAFGKLEGTLGRLAFMLHLLENPSEKTVGPLPMMRAVAIVKTYIVPSYRYAFSSTGGLSTNGIERVLAEYVLWHADKPELQLSTLRHNLRNHFKGNEQNYSEKLIRDAMTALEAINWVKVTVEHYSKTTWAINPDLLNAFSERRKAIIAARQAIYDSINESSVKRLGRDIRPESRNAHGYTPE